MCHLNFSAGKVSLSARYFQSRHCDEGTLLSFIVTIWRCSKSFASNHVKVDRDSQTVVCDEMLEDLDDIEELRDSLPEHQPRFCIY